jgi:hypothetical protein
MALRSTGSGQSRSFGLNTAPRDNSALPFSGSVCNYGGHRRSITASAPAFRRQNARETVDFCPQLSVTLAVFYKTPNRTRTNAVPCEWYARLKDQGKQNEIVSLHNQSQNSIMTTNKNAPITCVYLGSLDERKLSQRSLRCLDGATAMPIKTPRVVRENRRILAKLKCKKRRGEQHRVHLLIPSARLTQLQASKLASLRCTR